MPPTTLRIAVASTDGTLVDLHFGQTENFRIYDVTTDGPSLVEVRVIAEHAQPDENARVTICRMIGDCSVVLLEKAGETPKRMLAEAGVEAIVDYLGKSVDDSLRAVFRAKTAA